MNLIDLKDRAEQRPFRPFVIETVGGRLIAVNEPEQIFFPVPRPKLVIIFDDGGRISILEAEGIASLSTA